jgi:hypothetical protein
MQPCAFEAFILAVYVTAHSGPHPLSPVACPACAHACDVIWVYQSREVTPTWLTAKCRDIVSTYPDWCADTELPHSHWEQPNDIIA